MRKFVIKLLIVLVLPAADALAQPPEKSAEQLPITSLPIINNGTTKKISLGQWQEAGRKVFLEAVDADTKGTDTVLNMALSGYIEDALQALPNLRPESQSWVLYSAARELRTLKKERRISMFRQAAEIVRVKKMPANIKADALAHASIGLLDQGETDEALAIIREALQSAMNEPNEEGRGAALRAIADDLEKASWMNVSPLLPIAEQAASSRPILYCRI